MGQEITALATLIARKIVQSSIDPSWFQVHLNGVAVALPSYTLRLYTDCLHWSGKDLLLAVEEAHWKWLFSRLSPRATFLDVGASSGLMSVPFGLTFPDATILAFEPSRTARNFLGQTLEKNRIRNVTIMATAITDNASGHLEFVEFGEDVSGNCPFKPETSRLATPHDAALADAHLSYTVETTTLDAIEIPAEGPVIVKVDVEGFEASVLSGAHNLIVRRRPSFAIDIHDRIGGNGNTEPDVRTLLMPYHYKFGRVGHVLLCEPP
jgi:FkbM family methyltransferase